MTRSKAAKLTEHLTHHLRVTQNVTLYWSITNCNLNSEAILMPPRHTPSTPSLEAPRALLRPGAPSALRSQQQVGARSPFGSLRIEAQSQKVEPEMLPLPIPLRAHVAWTLLEHLSLKEQAELEAGPRPPTPTAATPPSPASRPNSPRRGAARPRAGADWTGSSRVLPVVTPRSESVRRAACWELESGHSRDGRRMPRRAELPPSCGPTEGLPRR